MGPLRKKVVVSFRLLLKEYLIYMNFSRSFPFTFDFIKIMCHLQEVRITKRIFDCAKNVFIWFVVLNFEKNSLRATLTYFFPAVLFLLTSSQPCLCGCQKKRIVHHRNVYKIYLLVCSTRKCCASPIFRMRNGKKQLNFKVNVHIS